MPRSTSVYLLIDPRDGFVFYVGISVNPWKRLGEHRRNKESAAYLNIFEMSIEYVEPILSIAATWSNRKDAEAHEQRLIAALPCVLNRRRSA